MKTQTQAAGCRTSPPRCLALIRRCDGCQTVTAIDLDNTLKHKRDMQMLGQTVHEVTEDEAMRLWQGAGPCRCMQNASVRGGAVAPYPGDCMDVRRPDAVLPDHFYTMPRTAHTTMTTPEQFDAAGMRG